ncbi:MAG: hypothetical protein COS87_00960 [Chloroflexi bacterium CG07_land_8_20_14_0_80_45_17]|nr:MAG: hypothetical protein COS87_00960 [Chloroflexi bacterium CG07_land_8_20_14_0_80_45_17]
MLLRFNLCLYGTLTSFPTFIAIAAGSYVKFRSEDNKFYLRSLSASARHRLLQEVSTALVAWATNYAQDLGFLVAMLRLTI